MGRPIEPPPPPPPPPPISVDAQVQVIAAALLVRGQATTASMARRVYAAHTRLLDDPPPRAHRR